MGIFEIIGHGVDGLIVHISAGNSVEVAKANFKYEFTKGDYVGQEKEFVKFVLIKGKRIYEEFTL